jgi:putative GTP pyrophosphokinase
MHPDETETPLAAHPAHHPSPWTTADVTPPVDGAVTRLMHEHRFGITELRTKLDILRAEFLMLHDHNPIEHISSRLKPMSSILEKLERKGLPVDEEHIRAGVTDVAGLRVVCSFRSDVYAVGQMLSDQADVTVLRVRDYIAHPKPNGYRSLHLLVEVPVFLSSAVVPVTAEIQLRTAAMDFWASLEHKIRYKYRGEIPAEVIAELCASALAADQLDQQMHDLHQRVHAGHEPLSTSSRHR